MQCACPSLYPHLLILSLPIKPKIGALLLTKRTELTIPVQQEEKSYEVGNYIVHMSFTLNSHALGVTVVILSVCVPTYIISYIEQLIS